jgi:hypothetical protein
MADDNSLMADDNALNLHIDYQRPPTALDLADLLKAIAQDYQRMPGGSDLVVSQIRSGSIDIWLKPVLETVATAKTLWEFVTTLKNVTDFVLGMAKFGSDNKVLDEQVGETSKTITALAKMAEKTRGRAKIRYRKNGQGTELEIDVNQASEIKRNVRKLVRQRASQPAIAEQRLPQVGEGSTMDTNKLLSITRLGTPEKKTLLVWTKLPTTRGDAPGVGVVSALSNDPKWIVFQDEQVKAKLTGPAAMDFGFLVDVRPLQTPEGTIGYLVLDVHDSVPRWSPRG